MKLDPVGKHSQGYILFEIGLDVLLRFLHYILMAVNRDIHQALPELLKNLKSPLVTLPDMKECFPVQILGKLRLNHL